jgi:prohibitin 2
MTRIRKIAAGLGCFILVFIAAIMFYFSRSEWIDAGHVGVIYNANGGLDRSHVRPPERVFIGWGQRLYQYPTMLQNAIYSQDPTEGEYKSADGVQVTTKDNQNTIFDISVIYRVRKDDVFKAFDSFGAISIEDVQRLHIRRALKEAANNIGTQYDVFDLMGAKRLEASQKLTVEMQRLLSYKGISVELAMFCACEPTSDLQNKINARVNAYTDLQISQIRSQIAEIDRKTAVVLAEAQHQARQISAAKTQGSSLEMLQLQTDQAAIERWNGELPPIQQAPGQTIVIGSGEMDRIVGGNGARDK